MLIELLSGSNYANYNIKLAQLFGLHTAIYLSEIMNINDKAVRKDKLDGEYFNIDRNYIMSRTTLTEEEQKSIEESLINVKILNVSESGMITLNLDNLVSLMMSTDEELVKDINTLVKPKKSRRSKNECIVDNLKKCINTSNEELYNAYCGWIEGVYSNPKGFLSKQAVAIFQKEIDAFANHNLDVALAVVSIATVNGWKDAHWAIKAYNDRYKVNYHTINFNMSEKPMEKCSKVELSSEEF
jgi:hypothetical protein